MMKTKLMLVSMTAVALGVAVLGGSGCKKSEHEHGADEAASHEHAAAATKYTCPMHPEVVQDKPANCPKCGMKLVEKK